MFTPRKPMRYLTPAQRAVVCQARAYVAEPGTRDVPDDVRETIQGGLARVQKGGLARALGRRMSRLFGPPTIPMHRGSVDAIRRSR